MDEINLFDLTKEMTVLYVEDDHILRQKNISLFKELFFDVHEATDGRMALGMYKENLLEAPYDIIISDINMPNMDGIEMSQNILNINPNQAILIISAHHDSHLLVDLMELGVVNFIQKPIQLNKFRQKLITLCQEILNNKKTTVLQKEYEEFHKLKKQQSKELVDQVLADILQLPESTIDIP